MSPEITYKGKPHTLKITNATMMRFTRAGGDFKQLESDPVAQAITLLCAALNLPGDPIDHADDFPPISQVVDGIKFAIEAYNTPPPGENNGNAQ